MTRGRRKPPPRHSFLRPPLDPRTHGEHPLLRTGLGRTLRGVTLGVSDMALVLGGVLVVRSLIGTIMFYRLDWKKP